MWLWFLVASYIFSVPLHVLAPNPLYFKAYTIFLSAWLSAMCSGQWERFAAWIAAIRWLKFSHHVGDYQVSAGWHDRLAVVHNEIVAWAAKTAFPPLLRHEDYLSEAHEKFKEVTNMSTIPAEYLDNRRFDRFGTNTHVMRIVHADEWNAVLWLPIGLINANARSSVAPRSSQVGRMVMILKELGGFGEIMRNRKHFHASR